MLNICYIKVEPTTFLMKFKKGKLKREGKGLAFWYFAPTTSLVAIPTSTTDIPFIFKETSKDFQEISIQGQLTFRIANPKQLAELMNYTLNPKSKTMSYLSEDPQKLANRIVTLTQVKMRAELAQLTLRESLSASRALVKIVMEELKTSEVIHSLGLEIVDLSITAIQPTPDTSRALEAAVREQLLEEADVAINQRRNAAIEQERALKENELRTELAIQAKQREISEAEIETQRIIQEQQNKMAFEQLNADIEKEEKRQSLIDLETKNNNKQADSQAYALDKTFSALAQVDVKILETLTASRLAPQQFIAQAFKELATHSDKIGQLNISPDLLQALSSATQDPSLYTSMQSNTL